MPDKGVASVVGGAEAGRVLGRTKAIVAGSIGNVLEWFDFTTYGYMASYLGTLFFPSSDPLASMFAAFAALAVGAILRPLGAVIFGWIGDRAGRRTSMTATVLIMAGATAMIGILPTHARIGVLAPVLLIVCRLVQGLSTGGQWGGAAAFLVEYSTESRRGVVGSLLLVSGGLGFILASSFGLVLTSVMSRQEILAWGWRLPFLAGILLGAVGIYFQLYLEDTPKFKVVKEQGQTSKSPLLESLRTQWKGIMVVFGFYVIQSVGYWGILVFMPSYSAQVLKLPASQAFASNLIQLLVYVLMLPVMGALSDRIGRRPLLLGAPLMFIVVTYPLFYLIVGRGLTSLTTLILCEMVMAIVLAAYNGPAVAAAVEIFPTRLRYTSLSIGFNLSVAMFGMTSPMISTYLIRTLKTPIAPAYVIIGAALISFVTVLFGVKETTWEPLR